MPSINKTKILKNLANLQLSIGLLITIGFMIALGTIIEQDQSLNFYKENYPEAKTIPCRTFQDAFELAQNDSTIKAIIPEQNQLIGSINIETLILKYRLNIFSEHFYRINHNLLVLPSSKLEDVKEVHSHTAALSQTSGFIRQHKLKEIVMADTAGSASYISKKKR